MRGAGADPLEEVSRDDDDCPEDEEVSAEFVEEWAEAEEPEVRVMGLMSEKEDPPEAPEV
jgi:hypothetical protein